MAKAEVPIQSLDNYLPTGAYPYVAEYLHQFGIHLTISRERSTSSAIIVLPFFIMHIV